MIEIIEKNNNFFIKIGMQFYGHFHSVAEAEYNLNNINKFKLEKPLSKYKSIKVCYWG